MTTGEGFHLLGLLLTYVMKAVGSPTVPPKQVAPRHVERRSLQTGVSEGSAAPARARASEEARSDTMESGSGVTGRTSRKPVLALACAAGGRGTARTWG